MNLYCKHFIALDTQKAIVIISTAILFGISTKRLMHLEQLTVVTAQ